VSKQWLKPEQAAEWDAGGGTNLPTRAEQQELLLALLAGLGDGGLLDLGVGSGLVAEAVLDMLPRAELVGVDYSPAMLDLARKRLSRFGARAHLCHGDLSTPETIDLPRRGYAAVFSVQTLHHLDEPEKTAALAWMAGLVESGGLVVVVDRVKVDERLFRDWYVAWRRIDPTVSDTYTEFVAHLAEGGDQPSTLEDHIAWMRAAGLAACCLHLYGDRALLVGRKAG
jgi:ubiquinone/menaquinone biosynthesis C-methylase UbiE